MTSFEDKFDFLVLKAKSLNGCSVEFIGYDSVCLSIPRASSLIVSPGEAKKILEAESIIQSKILESYPDFYVDKR